MSKLIGCWARFQGFRPLLYILLGSRLSIIYYIHNVIQSYNTKMYCNIYSDVKYDEEYSNNLRYSLSRPRRGRFALTSFFASTAEPRVL